MLNYLNTHPDEFFDISQPCLIGSMQLFGGIIAEITNLFMLATRDSVEYCITFFVAFHVLTKIDNIYAEGVCENALLNALGDPLIF